MDDLAEALEIAGDERSLFDFANQDLTETLDAIAAETAHHKRQLLIGEACIWTQGFLSAIRDESVLAMLSENVRSSADIVKWKEAMLGHIEHASQSMDS